jgi:hypothetical protein
MQAHTAHSDAAQIAALLGVITPPFRIDSQVTTLLKHTLSVSFVVDEHRADTCDVAIVRRPSTAP